MANESVRVEGLAGVLNMLRQLPPEIVSKSGGPVKLALKRAADVLRNEAIANVNRIIAEPNLDGKESRTTGLLAQSIISKRTRMPPGVNGEAFIVSVKKGQRYPDSRQGKRGGLTAVQIGRQLETGTEKRAAKPWIRPAFDSKKVEAVDVFTREMETRTQKIIDKLARQAR